MMWSAWTNGLHPVEHRDAPLGWERACGGFRSLLHYRSW
jgi:hypothetical protein